MPSHPHIKVKLMTYLSILQPQANPYLLVRPHILMPGPFHLCILVILLRQSAGLNANYSSVPKMESLLNINRTVLRSLVLALRFPNLVIPFRQSANIKDTHSRTKVKSFLDPPRMSSAASCLPFHLSIVDINLQQYACLTTAVSRSPSTSRTSPGRVPTTSLLSETSRLFLVN